MFKNEFSCGALILIGLLIGTGWLLQAQTQPPNNVTQTESQPESSSVQVTSKAQSNTSTVVPPLGPKKSHATRIGVVQPVVHLGGPTDLNIADALRRLIVQHLNGPNLEVTSITAISPIEVNEEAKQKECDYVLFSTLTQKASSGRLGLLKKAAPFAAMIPGVGAVAGIGGAIAGVAGAAASTAELGSLIKAKTEDRFEYRLVTPTSDTPVLANAERAKAKNDGDDIITQLVTQADTDILANLGRKR